LNVTVEYYVRISYFHIRSVAAGPPGTPVVENITPNSATLAWTKPTDAGGGKIKGYIVEVKPKDGDWTEVNSVPTKDTSLTVPNLKEGKEYQFRVKAVNEAGPGTPSTATGPIVAEKQPGRQPKPCVQFRSTVVFES
jgi:predicted phage tail protein